MEAEAVARTSCYITSNLLHLFHQHLQHVTPVTPTYPTCTHVVTPTPPTCYTCYPVTPTSPTCYTCCYTNTPRLLHLLHQHLQLISGWCNLDLFLDAKAMLTKASLVSTTVSWSVPRWHFRISTMSIDHARSTASRLQFPKCVTLEVFHIF